MMITVREALYALRENGAREAEIRNYHGKLVRPVTSIAVLLFLSRPLGLSEAVLSSEAHSYTINEKENAGIVYME